MTIFTLFQYLSGRRDAIIAIANCPGALWLGLLFVLSAGFAREYDGVDLLHEPWHLVVPLAASLASSTLLFALLWIVARGWRKSNTTFLRTFWPFLSLFWMTAPLAWLYAIPVERFLSPTQAIQANVYLLGVVAAWRVILMVRVVNVLYASRLGEALAVVMLFSDTVALVVLGITPFSVISVMGGVRAAEGEQILHVTSCVVVGFGLISWPIWYAVTRSIVIRAGDSWTMAEKPATWTQGVSASLWSLGCLSLVAWIPLLLWVQPEQQLRRRVECHLQQGRYREALQIMSAHEYREFPPHWAPLQAAMATGRRKSPLIHMLPVLDEVDSRPWVREMLIAEFRRLVFAEGGPYYFWRFLDRAERDRYLQFLEQMPEDSSILDEHRAALAELIEDDSWKVTDAQEGKIRKFIDARSNR